MRRDGICIGRKKDLHPFPVAIAPFDEVVVLPEPAPGVPAISER
jgi:hypothetical protein